SVYTTDRGHLHHCLLRHGFSTRRVLLCVSLCCLATVVGALASVAFHSELFAVVSALAVIGILVTTRLFGHAELALIKEYFLRVAMSLVPRRGPNRHHEGQVHLQGTADWKAFWSTLTASAPQLNLKSIRLDVN